MVTQVTILINAFLEEEKLENVEIEIPYSLIEP